MGPDVLPDSPEIEMVLQQMLEKLVPDYAPRAVILFGSYAYGTPGPDSDVDLLIIKETSERFIDRWAAVQRILTGSHHALPVETLVLTPHEVATRTAAGDQFIATILAQGRVLYAG